MKVLWCELQFMTGTRVACDGPGEYVRLIKKLPGMVASRRQHSSWSSVARPVKWLHMKAQHIRAVICKIVAGGPAVPYWQEELGEMRGELHDCRLSLSQGQEQCRLALIHFALLCEHEADEHLLHSVDAIRQDLHDMVARAVAHDQSEAKQKWREWLQVNLIEGARPVHKWTRMPSAPSVTRAEPNWRGGTQQEQFEAEVDRLRALWRASDSDEQWHDHRHELRDPPCIDMQHLTWASMSFGANAAYSGDGLHPRQYSVTGPRSINMLSKFVHALEDG